MPKNHLKRLNAPNTWNIHRKLTKLITRPNPGGHPQEMSISINTLMKENLKLAKTKKEVKYLLQNKLLLVNGKERYDERYPVGFMDVLSIPKLKESFVLSMNKYNQLAPIKATDATTKLSKIIGKKLLSKKATQLNLHDGNNIIVTKDTYKTGDTIQITIPKMEIKTHVKFEKGAKAFVFKGKNCGYIYDISKIEGNIITLKTKDKEITTRKSCILVVGKDKPIMKLD